MRPHHKYDTVTKQCIPVRLALLQYILWDSLTITIYIVGQPHCKASTITIYIVGQPHYYNIYCGQPHCKASTTTRQYRVWDSLIVRLTLLPDSV